MWPRRETWGTPRELYFWSGSIGKGDAARHYSLSRPTRPRMTGEWFLMSVLGWRPEYARNQFLFLREKILWPLPHTLTRLLPSRQCSKASHRIRQGVLPVVSLRVTPKIFVISYRCGSTKSLACAKFARIGFSGCRVWLRLSSTTLSSPIGSSPHRAAFVQLLCCPTHRRIEFPLRSGPLGGVNLIEINSWQILFNVVW